MNKRLILVVINAICAMALATGCAKKDLVRSSEPVQPAVVEAAPAAPAFPVKSGDTSGEEVVSEEAAQGEAAPETMPAAAVKAALDNVYFGFDSYLLSTEAREVLQKNAQVLSGNSTAKIRIEGHTDERGSDSYNLALGERRATSVRDYLVNLGVAEERLSVLSYGEERPAVQGHDEKTWAKNRRVELIEVER